MACKATSILFMLVYSASVKADGLPPVLNQDKTTSQRKLDYVPYVRQGTPFEFVCAASGQDPITYRWTKDGKPLEPSSDSRIKIDGGVVKIASLNHKLDDGKYQCTASNKYGSDITSVLAMQVAVVGSFEDSCVASGKIKYINVTIGKPLTLVCPSTTYFYPRVNDWGYKRSGPAHSIELNVRRSMLKSGALYFSYVEESDVEEIDMNGGIRCIIHSGGEEVISCPFKLRKIEGKAEDFGPIFIEKLENKTGVAGSFVDFSCIASGKPTPTIQWFKESKEISKTPYNFLEANLKLRISPLAKVYEGEYECRATSTYGGKTHRVSSKAYLKVEVKPTWQVELKDVTKTEGEDLAAVCEAIGDPTPIYEWFKDGNKLTNRPNLEINGGSMMLTTLAVNDTGVYQCSAKNKLMTIFTSMKLTVAKRTTLPPTTTEATTATTIMKTTTGNPTTAQVTTVPSTTIKPQNNQVSGNKGNIGNGASHQHACAAILVIPALIYTLIGCQS